MKSTKQTRKIDAARKPFRFEVAVEPDRCKGCGYCVLFCAAKVLKMGKTLNQRGIHIAVIANQSACTGCLQCADICPDAAISIGRIARR